MKGRAFVLHFTTTGEEGATLRRGRCEVRTIILELVSSLGSLTLSVVSSLQLVESSNFGHVNFVCVCVAAGPPKSRASSNASTSASRVLNAMIRSDEDFPGSRLSSDARGSSWWTPRVASPRSDRRA